MSNCNTCNTCSQPVRVCCCPPTPAPTPVVPPVVVCKSPIELLFEQSLICFNDTACVNPLNYIIEQVSNFVPDPLEKDATAIGQFLNGGVTLASCDLCCPKCAIGNGFIYVLTDTKGFINLYEPLLCKFTDPCCISLNANTALYADFKKSLAAVSSEIVIPSCCNNFTTYVEELKNITDCPNSFLQSGIVEYGFLTPDGESQLHNVALMIQSIYPAATPTELCTYVTTLLATGLVIYCDSNGMFIGGIDSFLNYAASINITCIN